MNGAELVPAAEHHFQIACWVAVIVASLITTVSNVWIIAINRRALRQLSRPTLTMRIPGIDTPIFSMRLPFPPKPKAPRRWFLGRSDIGDYMHRWMLVLPWGSIRLHHILLSDAGRDLHDHPWDWRSVLLAGSYVEMHWQCDFCGSAWRDGGQVAAPRRWLSVVRRKAEQAHRIILPDGRTAWTLVLTGPERRAWGFRTAGGWVSSGDYKRQHPELAWEKEAHA